MSTPQPSWTQEPQWALQHYPRAQFEPWNHQQNTQKCQKHGTKWAMKKTFVYRLRAKMRKSSSTSAGNVHTGRPTLLSLWTHPWMTTKVCQALTWELRISSREQENSQTQSLWIMKINYIWWGFLCMGQRLEDCQDCPLERQGCLSNMVPSA